MLSNVIVRSAFHGSFVWTPEVARLGLTILAFPGGALAYRRGQHIAVEVLIDRLPPSRRATLQAVVDWIVLEFGVAGAVLAVPAVIRGWAEQSPILGIRETWFAIPIPVAMLLIVAFAAQRLWPRPLREVAVAGVIVLAFTAVAAVFRTVLGFELLDPTGLIVVLVLLAVMLAISVPVGFALGIGAFGYGYLSGSVPPSSVPSTMLDSVNNFVLLALPFFIFAGFIMTTGGLSRPMAEFVRMLIGRVRGGLLHVVIVSMYLFSGMSGSKLADVAAVGSTLKDVLRQAGYEPEETAAVLAASAAMGETVPPSIAMIVLGSITSLSIGALFAAGLVPAALIAACLMVIVWLRAGKFPTAATPQWSRRVVVATTARAIPAFILPVILVAGIVTGVATPTEVSTAAVAYGLVVALLYRTLGLRNFWGLAIQTATMAGMILFITSTASAFSWMLAIADVPQSIAALLNSLPGGGWLFLLASIGAVTAMGTLLEGLPALLIFGPLLLPVAVRVGVNPLQYGIVLIISMGIGAFAPPLGIGAYVACSVADADLARTTRAAAPYMIALAVGVVLIAIVPGLSLALPDALHLAP